jgi:hypothetical protein
MVHNLNSGELLLQFDPSKASPNEIDFRLTSSFKYALFNDKKGKPHLAMIARRRQAVHEVFIASNNTQTVEDIMLPPTHGFQWLSTKKGELYGAYTYRPHDDLGEKENLAVWDISDQTAKEPIYQSGEYMKKDDRLLGFVENNKGEFTALLVNRRNDSVVNFKTIDFSKNASTQKWEGRLTDYEPLLSMPDKDGLLRRYVNPVVMHDAAGELFFITYGEVSPQQPALMFKHGLSMPQPIGQMQVLTHLKVLTKSNGSQVLVGAQGWNKYGFYMFDLNEGQIRFLGRHESFFGQYILAGFDLTDKDDVLLYRAPSFSTPSEDVLTPMRVTGTFKPGDIK